MAVVTNIDSDHLDTYRDINDIKSTFKKEIFWRDSFHSKVLTVKLLPNNDN